MKHLLEFISNNKVVLAGMLIGLIIGYLYWFYFSCYGGIYPWSPMWWANCIYGIIIGGFIASLAKKD